MQLLSEIHEQGTSLARLLDQGREQVEAIAAELHRRPIRFIFLAARGTSDNAGRYANYLWGAHNRLPMALATPSLFSLYRQPPRLEGALVVGISQSGQSPDILSVVVEGRRQGCPTLAITNDSASPLARAADFVIDIQSGPEQAVAASKTYTGELLAIAMLSAALEASEERWHDLARLPGWIKAALDQDHAIAGLARRYKTMQHCVVLGRGFNYATAFEWALKLKELTYVVAEPYSSADFLHGPIAMISGGFPVMASVAKGALQDSLLDLLKHLRHELQAELVVISNLPEALALAQSPLEIPADLPEWLSPLVAIIPAQLFACHLAVLLGHDPDQPRTISKVTRTR